MAKVAFEKSAHEFLESYAFRVEFRAVERDTFKMLHALRENRRINIDPAFKNGRVLLFLRVVKLVNASGEFLRSFIEAALKFVRLAILALRVLFIAVLYEDDFAERAESPDGIASPAFPKSLMTFANRGAEFFARNGGKVSPGNIFVKAPFGQFAVANGKFRHDVSFAFLWWKLIEAQQTTRKSSDGTAIKRAETGAIPTSLLDGLRKLRI